MLLLDQVRACVHELRLPLERVWPIVSINTARVLRLTNKGRIVEGGHADLLVLRRDSLELVATIARGRVLVKDGAVVVRDGWVDESDRSVNIHGEKTAPAHA
jgi:beta-aspartyl-dipeptidase (metallo-type)